MSYIYYGQGPAGACCPDGHSDEETAKRHGLDGCGTAGHALHYRAVFADAEPVRVSSETRSTPPIPPGKPATGSLRPPVGAIGTRMTPAQQLQLAELKRNRVRSGLDPEDPDTSDELETGVSPERLVRERELAEAPQPIYHPEKCACLDCRIIAAGIQPKDSGWR